MTRGMSYKLIFIILLITLSVLLILPTVGSKKMKIDISSSATAQEIEAIESRFKDKEYEVTKDGNSFTVTGSNLTDAIMNEIAIMKGVKDVHFLKHWVENTFLAKKINLGLDLQGGMDLVLQANFEGIKQKLGRELTEKDRNEITSYNFV